MQNTKSYICQMKFSGCALLVLLSINVFAQINILVKDETSQKFELGLDGFFQTDAPSSAFLVTDLDTSFHYLRIKLLGGDQIEFSKKIQFRKKGTYSYVITQNFKGNYQLRYRGSGKELAGNLGGQPFKMEKTWFVLVDSLAVVSNDPPQEIAPRVSDSLVIKPKLSNPGLKNPIIRLDTIKNITSIIEQASQPKKEIAIEKKDSLQKNIPPPIEVPIKLPKADTMLTVKSNNDSLPILKNSFDTMLVGLDKEEFEFNKLNTAKTFLINNPITVEEIQQVFKKLKYDNTRIQFLGFAVERLKDPAKISELENSFDYDLTKQQFRKEYLK